MNKNDLIEQTKTDQDPNRPIAAGDLVHLKSGGPTMTVRSIEGDIVECEWFDKSALKKHKFKLHSLRRGPHSNRPIFSINFGPGDDENSEKPPWERGNKPGTTDKE
jgi:uncharacterized protein YodC (DUF2158 family)